MDEELKRKVINEIEKSGYPLEFYCKKEIGKSGWLYTNGKQYTAKDGGLREIDIETLFYTESGVSLYTILMIECKKNESNPWIFFEDRTFGDLKIHSHITGKNGKLNYYDIKGHHYSSCKDSARSFVVAFKPEDSRESRQIYEAVNRVIGYFKSQYKERGKKRKSTSLVNQYYFCVVFDGNLVLANLYNGELSLKESQHILLEVSNCEDQIFDNYNIDIVKKEYFSEYLQLLKKDHELVLKYLNSQEESLIGKTQKD